MLDELNKIHTLIMKQYTQSLKLYDLTYMQWLMLKELYTSDKPGITAKDLELLTNQNKRLVSINLQKLEDLNFITRVSKVDDKREKEIILQDYVVEICDDLLQIETEIIEQHFQNLTTEEYNLLLDLLKKIN